MGATFLLQKFGQDKKVKNLRWDRHYEPNIEFMRALCHQLQSCFPFGLSEFQAARAPLPIAAGETRYFVPVAELPHALTDDMTCGTRSCIQGPSGDRRLEVAWPGRKLLVTVLDCGSIGWPSQCWMGSAGNLRCVFYTGPPHIKNNRFKAAVNAAQL